MKQGIVEKSAAVETDSQALELIQKYTRRKMAPEELYTFSLVLCDNEVDRDHERFTIQALERLASLFPGTTGIFDHDPKGEKQTARIYRCYLETNQSRTTAAGERYTALKADAYMVRCPKNADLILEIDAGIKKELSVGCAVESAVCSICGADRRKEGCRHIPGKSYTVQGEKRRCHIILDKPTDAYEWSFVAVPSQPAAGITKGAGSGQSATEAMLRSELENANAQLAFYRAKQQDEALRLSLLVDDSADAALLRKSLSAFSAEELDAWCAHCRDAVDKRFPPLVQTAPPPEAGQNGDNNISFKI